MTQEPEFVLRPAFTALRELRKAYASDSGPLTTECEEALQKARGAITSKSISSLVDRQMMLIDTARPIRPDQRKRVLAIEVELAKHIGDGRDKSALEQEIRRSEVPVAQRWCRSASDLADYLDSSHEELRKAFQAAPRWKVVTWRRNRRALLKADRSVLAVGIVLVDLLQLASMPDSYSIGVGLATGGRHQ